MVASRTKPILVLALLVAALMLVPALANVGISISPSAGDYSFKSLGGAIDIIVANHGDESTLFSVRLSDEAAAFSSIDQPDVTIAPGAYAKFRVSVSPTAHAAAGRAYPLTITAATQDSSGATSVVSANLKFLFTSAAGSTSYTVSALPSSIRPENAVSAKLFAFLAAIVLVALAYYLIKTKGPWKE